MDDKEKEFTGFADEDELNPEDFEDEGDDDDTDVNDDDDEHAEDDEDDTSEDDASDDNEDEDDEEEDGEAAKKAAEAEKNAKFAERRRAREKQEREAREARIKEAAKLEAELGIVKENPYTEKPIKDKEDLEVYKIMKQIDEEGGDPITDFPERIAKINKEKAKLAEEAAKQETAEQERLNREAEELHKAYPELDLKALGANPDFLDLLEEKEGRWTMKECYEYLEAKKETGKSDEVVNKGKKRITKVPGSNSNGGKKSSSSYLEMTDEEYLKLQKENGDFF